MGGKGPAAASKERRGYEGRGREGMGRA